MKKVEAVLGRLESDAGIFYYFEQTTSKHFLTSTDASKKYLAIGGTAQNSNEVGRARAESFVQGDGALVSGAATLSGGANSQKLLSTAGIDVDVAINGNGFPSVTTNNSTCVLISAVLDQGARTEASRCSLGLTRSHSACRTVSISSTSRRTPPGASTAF